MILKKYINKIVSDGISYNEYMRQFKHEVENTPSKSLVTDEKTDHNLKKLNFSRSTRIEKQYIPSGEIRVILDKIKEPQFWLVLSETWCGDSAQILPVLAKISGLNNNIKLRILQRDSNLEIMDQFLTNGTRSIPKLIAFSESGNEFFNWGARPAKAQEIVNELKSSGLQKTEWLIDLHKWYASNRGKEIENEIMQLIKNL